MALLPLCWFENQDGAGALARMAALANAFNTLTRIGTDADAQEVPPGFDRIVAFYAGLDPTVEGRVRLEANSFKKRYGRTNLEIPFINGTVEPGSNAQWLDCRKHPIMVEPGEDLFVDTLQNPAAAADQFCVAIMSDGKVSPTDPNGGFYIRTTLDASALTANAWNSRAMPAANFDEQLGDRNLDVLWAEVISTSVIAATIAFPGQAWEAPIAVRDNGIDLLPDLFRRPGEWGTLGSFNRGSRPSIRMVADAADNEAQPVRLFVKPR